jgi:hypothetical protein
MKYTEGGSITPGMKFSNYDDMGRQFQANGGTVVKTEESTFENGKRTVIFYADKEGHNIGRTTKFEFNNGSVYMSAYDDNSGVMYTNRGLSGKNFSQMTSIMDGVIVNDTNGNGIVDEGDAMTKIIGAGDFFEKSSGENVNDNPPEAHTEGTSEKSDVSNKEKTSEKTVNDNPPANKAVGEGDKSEERELLDMFLNVKGKAPTSYSGNMTNRSFLY